MAVFCNQATISYGGVVRQSNVACGELVETVRMTKTALIGTYDMGSVLTYIVNVTNEGDAPLSNLTFTDDLGQYDMGQASYTPLTYVDGSLKVFAVDDGVHAAVFAVALLDNELLQFLGQVEEGVGHLMYDLCLFVPFLDLLGVGLILLL